MPDENLISVLNNIELTEKGENKNELSAKSFITLSLIASGATQNEIPSAIAKIDNAYEKINAKLLQEKSLILRAEKNT
ncbi:MAG: hypothetical protein IKI31_06810 [Treponema sp.]|nr:hypothetical protein [Treponema sp.]